jgi:hypothetical protein
MSGAHYLDALSGCQRNRVQANRPDAGHNLALRQVAVADNTLAPIPGLELVMPDEKVRDLRLDRPGKQATRATAQDFSELIAETAWLNQVDDVRIRHGISLLRWRRGGFNYPHDMPPS